MNMCDMYFVQANAEASEDLLHVATLLHGDDTEVVLLVHPDQEGLLFIVPEKISVPNYSKKESFTIDTHVYPTITFATLGQEP